MEVMLVVLTKFQIQPCQIILITRRQAAGKLECFLLWQYRLWSFKFGDKKFVF